MKMYYREFPNYQKQFIVTRIIYPNVVLVCLCASCSTPMKRTTVPLYTATGHADVNMIMHMCQVMLNLRSIMITGLNRPCPKERFLRLK